MEIDFLRDIGEIQEIIELEKLYFAQEYWASKDKMIGWHKKNNTIFLTAHEDGNFAGYINIMPLKENIISKIKNGNYIDSRIANKDIYKYEQNRSYDLYLGAIAVHPDYMHKGIGSVLSEEFMGFLYKLKKTSNIQVNGIYADCVSKEGEKACQKYFGMKYLKDSHHNSKVYGVTF